VDVQKCKAEILQTEKDFEKMASEKGIKEAFLFYASDSVAMNRFNLIYKGKKQVNLYFDYVKMNDAQLNWTPSFVDVASSGDMGYTYGKYTYTHKDSTGKTVENKGVFHTVWKKQADGNWKFVWD
jgi:ketosteroid isomerase-like protein